MSLTLPTPLVEAFAVNGVKNAIPVASQIGITPGAASLNDGFPPQTMIPLVSGGIPPSGLDFNGIFYLISAYCAWLQGGGWFQFSAAFVTNNTGYAIGAILQSAADPSKFFYNTVANNANNPDSVITGWVPYSPISAPTGVQTAAPTAPPAAIALSTGVGFLDVTPSANGTLTNLTGGKDGQIVIVTNLSGAFSYTIQANANIRMVGDITLLQNNSFSLRFSSTLNKWVALNG